MWSSEDEEKIPRYYQFSLSARSSAKQNSTCNQPSKPTIHARTEKNQAKTVFAPHDSDCSVDSDSSGKEDDTAKKTSAVAGAPARKSTTPLGHENKVLKDTKLGTKTGLPKQPDVRPKIREASVTKKSFVGSYFDTAKTPKTSSGISEKKITSTNLSLKEYLPYKDSQPGNRRLNEMDKPRSFEKHAVKMSDSDRGLQYSKRDEKPSLDDFLPLNYRKVKSEPASQSTLSLSTNQGKPATRDDSVEGSRMAMAGLRLKEERTAAKPHQTRRVEQERGAVGGGPPSNIRFPKPSNSDSVDDSDDLAIDKLIPKAQRYVPPPNAAKRNRLTSEFLPTHKFGKHFDPKAGGNEERVRQEGRENLRIGLDRRGEHEQRRELDGREEERNYHQQRPDNRRDEYQQRRGQDYRREEERNYNQQRPENRRHEYQERRPHDYGREEERQNQQRPENRRDNRRVPGRQDGQAENRNFNRRQPDGFRPAESNLSFTRLRELKTRPPAEVIAALTYSKEGLSRLLKNEQKLQTDQTMMRLLLSALAKVSQCGSMPSQQGEILNLVRTSTFLKCLGTYLTNAGMTAQVVEVTGIIGESADLLQVLVTRFPSEVHDIVMAHAFLDMAVKTAKLRAGGDLPEDVARKVEESEVARDAAMAALQKKDRSRQGADVNEDSLTPPDDFRQISVFPTMEDLNKEELPFLRKNKVKGGYAGIDHYLDVQFRLLREDFVYPLREGIAEYLAMIAAPNRGRKLKDIRVYHDVHILRAVCLPSGLGHRLTFDVSRMQRVRWEVTKRLIYGSLVCLSADNFQTLFFATVTNREPRELKEGVVDVVFEHDLAQVSAIPGDTSFTMAETTAFFEAYRHVLSGLQKIHVNDLPFQNYIIACEKRVSEPKYLTGTQAAKNYDLRPLVDDDVTLREDRPLADQNRDVAYHFNARSEPVKSVPVLQRTEWPVADLLKLDGSQFEALHRALTKEFSVIQGPPGTGKTYVGLKIVKAMLHNRKCWDPDLNSCMLIVCYTNHALDQFLEGVVDFFKGQVVRVGSRSRSEKLEPCSLSNLRWKMRRERDDQDRDFREITRLRFQGHEAMDRLKDEIDTMGMKMESAKREILHEDVLMPYMLDRHYDRLMDARAYLLQQQGFGFVKKGKAKGRVLCMPEWLGIGAVLQNTHVTADDLHLLDEGLGEDDELEEIEGEIQALEENNRLDTEEADGKNDRKRKERDRKAAQSHERQSYLAVDISHLDTDPQAREQGGGGHFQVPKGHWKKIKRKLRRNVELDDRMTEMEEKQVRDLWELDFHQRWRLYRRWTQQLCASLQAEMRERERLYDELARRHQETLLQEDKYIFKSATVVAMTTTAAARYQSVLQEVKPRVIVVEEAAEVLEGHVITTLSGECQHLILIGDHKQLRPNPTVFALARKYNLELSLFERMINNGLRCDTLACQHRMRPEIASLVKPIYPDLQNHESVENYPPVKGVCSNLFFISHHEAENHDEETKSHSNAYEAWFAAQLCRYLLKQGYEPSQITVLTTYSGQLFQLKKLMPRKSIFEGVRVTVVDNFQGEENDIIILSLVRSNEQGSIGFLKIENRVCVALSRAKMGLYVLGNFDLLSAESNLWQTVTSGLQKKGQIGETLNLYCQNHPNDQGLVIQSPEDFDRAPEGGCMKPCTARLDCGHVCMRLCHPYDQDHKEYQCTKKCERKLACGHGCKKRCFENCGDCLERVNKLIPKCGHNQWMPCYLHPAEFVCQEACLRKLICGHHCGDKCGEKHQCYEKVEHTFQCGHTDEIWCRDRDTAKCKKPCESTLECGHKCSGTCKTCHGGRLHERCKNKCTKILVCGHGCRDACSYCPPCEHRCQNRCVHSECRRPCGAVCAPCMEPCVWQCPHHRCRRLCSEPCDREQCNEPCPKLLKCDHPCIGLCGEPCPELCRICDADTVTEIYFGTEDDPDARFVQLEDCPHVIEVSALDQWMTTTTAEHEDSIQLKKCPKCNTFIRKNLRYGTIIKTQLKDIEVIKDKTRGEKYRRLQLLEEVERAVEEDLLQGEEQKQDLLSQADKETEGGLVAVQNQMNLLDEVRKIQKLSRKKAIGYRFYTDALEDFEKWVCIPRLVFTEQEAGDAQREVKRLRHWLRMLVYEHLASRRMIKLPPSLEDPMKNLLLVFKSGDMYTEDLQDVGEKLLQKLEEEVPESGLGVTDKEKVMIVQAMGLQQGHWFKCPQGHVYCIADCGGATMESRCPECKATIGGTSHRLRSDNALATEMDGARRPAWPTMLDEYDLG